MKAQLAGSAIAALAFLVACGGGGGSSVSPIGPVGPVASTPPVVPTSGPSSAPTVAPTAAPTAAPRSIRFTWSGAAHSTTQARARRPFDTTIAGVEPIALGAPVTPNDQNDPAFRFGEANAVVSATEVDAAGSPVPSASPAYSVANTAVAQVSAVPQPSATPLVQVVAQAVGSTTTTVTFPDGKSGSVTTNAYATVHPSCPAAAYFGQDGYRYDATAHAIVVASAPANADFYFTGPRCDGAFQDTSATLITLHAPYGYQDVGIATPLASILTASMFVPQGTALPLTYSANGPLFWVVRSGTSGVYMKIRITGTQGSANAANNGIDAGEYDGDALASDATGVFAY